MPLKPIDYSNTCFYKIVCKDVDITDCYVGHTTNFNDRKRHHQMSCKNNKDPHYNIYVYQFIREHGGFDNFDMVLIDRYSCEDRLDALRKEREYIESLHATLNKVILSRTRVEYYKNIF